MLWSSFLGLQEDTRTLHRLHNPCRTVRFGPVLVHLMVSDRETKTTSYPDTTYGTAIGLDVWVVWASSFRVKRNTHRDAPFYGTGVETIGVCTPATVSYEDNRRPAIEQLYIGIRTPKMRHCLTAVASCHSEASWWSPLDLFDRSARPWIDGRIEVLPFLRLLRVLRLLKLFQVCPRLRRRPETSSVSVRVPASKVHVSTMIRP